MTGLMLDRTIRNGVVPDTMSRSRQGGNPGIKLKELHVLQKALSPLTSQARTEGRGAPGTPVMRAEAAGLSMTRQRMYHGREEPGTMTVAGRVAARRRAARVGGD